jgi:hypothetical protein
MQINKRVKGERNLETADKHKKEYFANHIKKPFAKNRQVVVGRKSFVCEWTCHRVSSTENESRSRKKQTRKIMERKQRFVAGHIAKSGVSRSTSVSR